MRRSLAYAAVVTSLFLAGCGDNIAPPPISRLNSNFVHSSIKPIDNLIIQLFPKGIETATGARWDRIDIELGSYVNGAWTGPSPDQGLKHTMDLIKFIRLKTGDIDASGLRDGESRDHAGNRLVTAMLLYLGTGDKDAPVPGGSADLVVAVVPAGAEASIVTPSGHAGLRLDPGSTSEERIISISKDETGRLDYSGRQYLPFYKFESLPHTRLNKLGRFAVCEVTTGEEAPTLAQHDRMHLAHDLPANPADWTPGARQVEGIEILPLVGAQPGEVQSGLIDCPNPDFGGGIGQASFGKRALYAVNKALSKVFSPKKLYAYDQGPEHFSGFFSRFASVDPPQDFVGIWNGTTTATGASSGQPVTLVISSQTLFGVSGEYRVAVAGSTSGYNQAGRLIVSSALSGLTGLAFTIDPFYSPYSTGIKLDNTLTLTNVDGVATLTGTTVRTLANGSTDNWSLVLTKGTTPTVTFMSNLSAAPLGSTKTSVVEGAPIQ